MLHHENILKKDKSKNMKLLLWVYKDYNLRGEVLQDSFVNIFHEANSSQS